MMIRAEEKRAGHGEEELRAGHEVDSDHGALRRRLGADRQPGDLQARDHQVEEEPADQADQ